MNADSTRFRIPGFLRRPKARPAPRKSAPPGPAEILIDGHSVPVAFRSDARARRIVLRLDKTGTGVVVTVPHGTSRQRALEFAASQAGWIWSRLGSRPEVVPFRPGALMPVRGTDHQIVHAMTARRGPVWTAEGDPPLICVSGDAAHLPRRLEDWLKKQARADLERATAAYARAMSVRVTRITLRDTQSRWGSCSSTGNLSFSWRLVMAPAFVLDAVAAHEVAHLVEMNHSPAFWRLLEHHCPATEEAKRWLAGEGRFLHRFGAHS